ncbi:MAG: hypothetical protein OEW22_13430 [Rubrivivax sp.]|nr:hypothetical protein [Rubrivivax sp.]
MALGVRELVTAWPNLLEAVKSGAILRCRGWPLAGIVAAMFGLICALGVLGDALRDALDRRTAWAFASRLASPALGVLVPVDRPDR